METAALVRMLLASLRRYYPHQVFRVLRGVSESQPVRPAPPAYDQLFRTLIFILILIEYHAPLLINRFSRVAISFFGTAPTSWSATCPSLKKSRVGIDMMLYRPAISFSWSVSTLYTFALPANSSATASTCGAIIRQGPHQTAQKSTSTGTSDFSTSSSKSAAVTAVALLIEYLRVDSPA